MNLFGRRVALPRSKTVRMSLGVLLLLGGLLWFLPVLGLWMLPAGLAVLSADVPWIRRHSARWAVAIRARWPGIARRLWGSSAGGGPVGDGEAEARDRSRRACR